MKRQGHFSFLTRAAMMLLAVMLTTIESWAMSGNGTKADPYRIWTTTDWSTFVSNVNSGTNASSYYLLVGDLTVTTMVGTSDHPFKGTFDGDGHTLTFDNVTIDEEYCAPFRYVDGATFNNLRTAGTVISTGKKYRSGLIGDAKGTTTINNCQSSVHISSTLNGDGTHGAFVGTVSSGTTTINNCLFDGEFYGSSWSNSSATTCWGGFVGWSGATTHINNSYFNPNRITISNAQNSVPFSRGNGVTVTNSYYSSNKLGTSQGASASSDKNTLCAALGHHWEIVGNKVLPIQVVKRENNKTYTLYRGANVFAYSMPNASSSYSQDANANEGCSKLFDGDKNSKWCYVSTKSDWESIHIDFEYPNAIVVKGYVITTGDDTQTYKSRNPNSWKLYGSSDKNSWTLIDEQTKGDLPQYSYSDKTYDVTSNTRGYKYYRFEVTSGNWEIDNNNFVCKCQLDELQLFGVPQTDFYNIENTKIVGLQDVYPYTGNNITPSFTLEDVNGQTVSTSDYDYSYSPSTIKEVGDYTLTITGKSNYSGSKSATFKVKNILQGEGTAENPYLIRSNRDWTTFTEWINNEYNTYGNKYYKLTADIDVTTMAGNSSSTFFAGTFDGNGHTMNVNLTATENSCAPFRYSAGVFKRLHITGTINAGTYKFAGGLIGNVTSGKNNSTGTKIYNCWSSVTINSDVNGDGTHGGFVGNADKYVEFYNCLFDGAINGTSTTNCGGFAGWLNAYFNTFSNCLMTGTISLSSNDGSGTFYRNGHSDTVTNCYYKTACGNEQGTAIGSMSNADLKAVLGNQFEVKNNKVVPVIDIKNINAGWMEYTKTLAYTGSNITLSPVVKDMDGNVVNPSNYTITSSPSPVRNAGDYTMTVTGKSANGYSGTLTGTFKVFGQLSGAGTEASPYIINNADDWDKFGQNLAIGYSYEGEVVKLNSNITVTTMVGLENAPFKGTFDGNNKTLDLNIVSTTTGNSKDEKAVAPFHFICDAVIKDLTVTGNITSASQYAAGLVGMATNTKSNKKTEITNCLVKPTITTTKDYSGGIVGYMYYDHFGAYYGYSNLYLTDCVFAGTIKSGNDEKLSYVGGLLGYQSDGKLYVNNCLENGTYTNVELMNPKSGSISYISTEITGFYYLNTIGNQGDYLTDAKGCHRVTKTVPTTDIYSTRTVKGYTVYQPATLTGVDNTYAYTGDAISISYALKMGTTDMVENTDYTVVIKNSSNATVAPADLKSNGNYTIHFTAKSGNAAGYKGETVYSFRISQAEALGGYTFATEGEGDSKVYLINGEDDLEALAAYVRADKKNTCEGMTFKLNDNITMTKPHTAIGYRDHTNAAWSFKGTFDGNNKTITGLTINKTSSNDADSHQGLFGDAVNAVIKDVTLVDCNITGYRYVGGIAGNLYGSSNTHAVIQNCHVSGTITSVISGSYEHGGIVGNCSYADITGCTVTGTISNNKESNDCGGIVGEANNSTITSCENSANITGEGRYYGGIVGDCRESTLSQCLNTGAMNVTEDSYRGAIVGSYYNGSYTNCYYTSGTSDKGEFVSAITSKQLTNITISEDATVTSVIDGTKYYKSGNWTLTLTPDLTDATFIKYICQGGTLTDPETPDGTHTLTIGNEPVTIIAVVSSNNGIQMSNVTISDIPGQRWMGNVEIKPAFTATCNNKTLVENTDYLVVYTENTVCGTATITLTGIGSYTGTTTKTFNIVDLPLQTPGADNSAENPYLIDSEDDLKTLASIVNTGGRANGFYKQTRNITLTQEHTAIGKEGRSFTGSYDGDNKTISGLVINKPNSNNQGLFGYYGSSSSIIQNVILVDCDITGGSYTGGIVGCSTGAIKNCKVSGSVKAASYNSSIGGIAGKFNSYNKVIDGCVNTANVTGTGSYHGGIVGDCYGTVQNCFSTGTVEGTSKVGSIIGDRNSSTLINNYHLSTTTGGIGQSNTTTGCDVEGAELAVKITKDNDLITLTLPDANYEWNGDKLYKRGTVVTLDYAVPAQGYFDMYTVSNGTISTPYIKDGEHTLTDFTEDVIISGSHVDHQTDFAIVGNSIIADIADITYDGSEHHPEPVVTIDNKQLIKDVNYTVIYSEGCTNAGQHTVTIMGLGQYINSTTKTFTISEFDVNNCDVTASDLAYTGEEFTVTPTVKRSSTTMTVGDDNDYTFTINPATVQAAGNYTLTITGHGNYTGTKEVSFKVYYATPTNLACTALTPTSATLTWSEAGIANQWTVEYSTDNTFATSETMTVNATSVSLKGLTEDVTCYARVKAVYGENEASDWSSVLSFQPTAKLTIGSGTSTTDYFPLHSYYHYDLTQQIYTSAELQGKPGTIKSLDFFKADNYTCDIDKFDIYLVSTTKNSFENNNDWIAVTDADKVYSGKVTFANNDWTTITLNTPFDYDGTSNIAMIVYAYVPSGSSYGNRVFRSYTGQSNQSIYYKNDYTDSTVNPTVSGSRTSTKNQVRIGIDYSIILANDDSQAKDDEKNSALIAKFDGNKANVTLADRILYKDGEWNTLCLPFDVTLNGSPLEGATVMKLNSEKTNLNKGTLTLSFEDEKDELTAGTPYIIKWDKGDDIKDPVFNNVIISSTTPTASMSSDNQVAFVGQYSTFDIVESGATGDNQGNINEIVLLSTKNKLGYSKKARSLHTFRCHFKTISETKARSFVIDFGDGETTGIQTMSDERSEMAEGWYTIDGRKLDKMPTKKGMYIHNDTKVVIK